MVNENARSIRRKTELDLLAILSTAVGLIGWNLRSVEIDGMGHNTGIVEGHIDFLSLLKMKC